MIYPIYGGALFNASIEIDRIFFSGIFVKGNLLAANQ
jgi:hypothetical protein